MKMIKYTRTIMPIIVLLVIWFISSQYSNPLFLPKPSTVLEDIKIMAANGMLTTAILKSFYEITLATLISCAISIPLGLLMFSFKWIDNCITPITNILRYFPGNAFYPLLILWIGIGDKMKITFLFVVTFVYFLPAIVFCIKDVDNRLVETAYTMGLNKFEVIIRVVLPYTAPAIFQNILIIYGMGWTYIPIAEMVNANAGLGYLINIGSARGRTDMVFTSIITIMILSWIIDTLGNKTITKIFNWKFKKQIED
jgi:NitT/TauT family transport system permease protein